MNSIGLLLCTFQAASANDLFSPRDMIDTIEVVWPENIDESPWEQETNRTGSGLNFLCSSPIVFDTFATLKLDI
jgi:hypothetical protein